jgi:hypothetical protein
MVLLMYISYNFLTLRGKGPGMLLYKNLFHTSEKILGQKNLLITVQCGGNPAVVRAFFFLGRTEKAKHWGEKIFTKRGSKNFVVVFL